ncbi:MAG: DUF1592 domain-containing protein [Pirellulaceae bacterium]
MKLRLLPGVATNVLALLACSAMPAPAAAAEPDETKFLALGASYEKDVQPLVARYCVDCHAAEQPEADLDLSSFAAFAQVRKQPPMWQKVREMLDSGQMPPKDAPQPTAAERTKLSQWVRGYLTAEAAARAGDPGRVVLRRLSNAEYTYTLRDLTGLAALDPAHEFPVDGAAEEGFSNTGSALVMSPALVTKYLDAAKEVAGQAVLLPDGFRFSPSETRRDWTNEILAEIRDFYGQFATAQGGDQVNLQGVVFETNEGGRLPLQKYFAATLAERDALRAGRKTIETVAVERKLNAKYLNTLWNSLSSDKLTSDKPSLLLDGLRTRWRAAGPDDAAALAAHVSEWQQELWRFTTVGHIGKVGGPKAWMEPVSPLVERQDIRLKFPATIEADGQVVLSLVASEAGDGNQHDQVVWQQPRLVTAGKPDVFLRDVRAARGAGWGVDPALFGKRPDGQPGDAASLYVRAGSSVEIRLPADLAAGSELVATGLLDEAAGGEGSVQLQLVAGPAQPSAALLLPHGKTTIASGPWTADNRQNSFATPIVVRAGSRSRQQMEAALAEFRDLFPAALCYTKIVPVDEVVTLTLLHREDEHLARLMLDDAQRAHLDRLWSELHYVSHDALTLVDAFAQLMEYATQDADPKVFEPLRQPIHDRAAAFRQLLIDTEPKHLDSLVEFAARAYRRPLTGGESQDLRALYAALRREELSHDEAFRLTLARVLVGPAFLYKLEKPPGGAGQQPVSSDELATRLSFFLWSSQPDEALRKVAAAGRLVEDDVLIAQTQRMLASDKTRRLATEFACQWLQIHDFANLDEKSERHFPEFAGLRGAMYEESIQFFVDLFQRDGSVLDILAADYAILNEPLAAHYGIPGVRGEQWRRVAGVKQFSRGGILGQATVLAKQSGASRTSPILRGNWVSEVLLGERLPRPPKGVPPLPDEEAGTELSVRQLVERHTSDAKCAVCHQRIDPFGFALESFDAIGRRRDKDLGGRPIDTRVTAPDGAKYSGIEGLRDYLLTKQREAFVGQFCRKLLGYALGRSVQLSDEPLLAEMQARLAAGDYRVGVAVEAIIRSRQFREIRGLDSAYDE